MGGGLPDLSSIRLFVLDVDGVLTDGTLWVADDGATMKRFSIRDGAGLRLLTDMGFRVAVISGHLSGATTSRFRTLGIEDVETGVADKGAAFEALKVRRGVTDAECAAMGDDLMDLPMLRRVRFAATVSDAHEEVLRVAHYVARSAPGRGAVREVAELLLRGRGLWERALERFA